MNEFQRKILGASVGNAIEFYDFSLFGALAEVIGSLFFPTSNKIVQLLASLTVFGAAFIMRPLGGLIVGKIGDTYGRKRALEISIAMMLVPSFLMGCLPTYKDIQIWATIMVVLLRLVQGMAAGGEFSSSLVYAVESTNGRNSAYWAAVVNAGANIGSLLGDGLVAIIRNNLTDTQLHQWGWRIPFLLTPVFGSIGLWLRRHIKDNHNHAAGHTDESCMRPDRKVYVEVLTYYWREILMLVLLLTSWGPIFYVCFVWIPVYLSEIIHSNAIKDP